MLLLAKNMVAAIVIIIHPWMDSILQEFVHKTALMS